MNEVFSFLKTNFLFIVIVASTTILLVYSLLQMLYLKRITLLSLELEKEFRAEENELLKSWNSNEISDIEFSERVIWLTHLYQKIFEDSRNNYMKIKKGRIDIK